MKAVEEMVLMHQADPEVRGFVMQAASAQVSCSATYASAVLAAGMALCLCSCATIDGSLKLSGGPLGELEFKPESCKSGLRQNFLGADLFGPSGAEAKAPPIRVVNGVVTRDPQPSQSSQAGPSYLRVINDVVKGPLVRFFDARLGDSYLQFTPDVCQRLKVDAENRPAEIPWTDGTVHLQCSLPDGTKANGALSFQKCQ